MGRAVGARVRGHARPGAGPRPGPRRDPSGRVQLPRHPDGPGQVPGQAAPPIHPRSRDRGRRGRNRPRGNARPTRAARDRESRVGRLRAAHGGAGGACAPDPGRDAVRSGGGVLRRLPDGLLGARPARRPPAWRMAPRPRGRRGRRARGGPAGEGARRARHRHGRHAGEAGGRHASPAPTSSSTTGRRTGSSGCKLETGGKGVDVVYDPVGGDTFDGSTKCIAFEGRLLIIGFAGGRIADVAVNRMLLKNIDVHRRPLGLLPATRYPARPGVDGCPDEALRRGPAASRDLPCLPPPRGGGGARGAGVPASYGKVVLVP